MIFPYPVLMILKRGIGQPAITPVLDDNGEVKYFIHSPINVTELYKLGEREKANLEALKNQQQQLYSTFMQAPVGIAIFKGPDYVIDLINAPCVISMERRLKK
ncbi:MAG: hypothetical protein WDO16_20780 [Bacteroidota bacterium]